MSRGDPRTAAVHAAAAEVGAWMRSLPGDAAREHRLGLAATRLPSVVFWYRQGLSSEEIGRRLTPFGCSSYGDRATTALADEERATRAIDGLAVVKPALLPTTKLRGLTGTAVLA